MICCTDPTCAEEAAVTIQRSIDISAAAFCLPHGYQREAELKQRLENYQMVTLVRPPTDLDAALARVQELEARGAGPDGDAPELADQLETALHTLELQSKTLETARTELADRETALQSLRRELERSRGELQTVKREAVARVELERLQANEATGSHVGPVTPPPPTRPDRK